MSKRSCIAHSLEEWRRDPSLTPGWKVSDAERQSQEDKLEALDRALAAAEAPLVADLRGLGFDVDSVWGLFNRKEPWRKDVAIAPWPQAVPVLLRHLSRKPLFPVREGIVRALTAPWAGVAFDRLVEELRESADPQVAAVEQRRAVDLVMAEAGDLYTRTELERIMQHRWESFRFALANAIGQQVEEAQLPVVVELLKDETHGVAVRETLADSLRRKMRRWRRTDQDVLALVEFVLGP